MKQNNNIMKQPITYKTAMSQLIDYIRFTEVEKNLTAKEIIKKAETLMEVEKSQIKGAYVAGDFGMTDEVHSLSESYYKGLYKK